jgi:exodeoxyribonuclease V gamma subunit
MISYVGRDVLDNSDKVASVLLSELLDYCRHSVICEGDGQLDPFDAQARVGQRLLVQHYLQPFDPRYFQAGPSPWFSFAGEYFAAAAPEAIPAESRWRHQSLPPEQNIVRRIQLDSLLAFVANPCKTLLRQRLGVTLDIRNEELSDTEVLQLDNLERFQLAQDAVTRQLQGVAQRDWEQLCRSSGVAPLGTPGQGALAAVWSSADEISQAIRPLLATEPRIIHVALDVGDYRLEGELGPVHEDCLLSWRTGKYQGKQTLQQWLRHNLANVGGESIRTRFVGTDGEYWFEPLAADTAKQWLHTLLQWYVAGQQRALPLFPETAWQWLEARAGNNPDGAMDKARLAWFGNQRVPGEGGDAWFSRFYSWPDVIGEEFERLAAELLEPARIARQDKK